MACHYPTTSVLLSRVLDDVGLNTRTVERRQRTYLKLEQLSTICDECYGQSESTYHFGSQIEGSTVDGLASDIDTLHTRDGTVVIQHIDEWVSGKRNLLMLKDLNIPSAYCRLQLLRSDKPASEEELPNNIEYEYDCHGKVLLRNSSMFLGIESGVIHGPALAHVEKPCRIDSDSVFAYRCPSWPEGGQSWLERVSNSDRHWPSSDILKFVRDSGCFLVPVGYRVSAMNEIEWRISPSLAERRFMLSMNIIQMKCYVLLKMIKKQFIAPYLGDVVSSYVMKTAMFNMMEKTVPLFWREDNLLVCLQQCLLFVFHWLYTGNCPNYLFPDENILTGKLVSRNKGPANLVANLIHSEGSYILEIGCDAVGRRLYQKLSARIMHKTKLLSEKTRSVISRCEYSLTHLFLRSFNANLFQSLDVNVPRFRDNLLLMTAELVYHTETGGTLVREAVESYITFFTSLLGSVLASKSLSEGEPLPDQAIHLMRLSFPADHMSVELKLASMLFCSGQYYKAKTLLEDVESRYDYATVQPVCGCYLDDEFMLFKGNFQEKLSVCTGHKEGRQLMACCVIFTPQEFYICPHELRIEMSRHEDNSHVTMNNIWMTCAVIDSVVLLYYLEYLTYRQLGNAPAKQKALEHLDDCIVQEEDFLNHKETALNVLGQCLEYEGRLDEAIYNYSQSNSLRPENNVAGWHSTVWHINNLKRGTAIQHLFKDSD